LFVGEIEKDGMCDWVHAVKKNQKKNRIAYSQLPKPLLFLSKTVDVANSRFVAWNVA